MIGNESQLREIISQYEELVKCAEAIVNMTEDVDFTTKYFDIDPRVLSDRSKADSSISICGTNRYYDYDHWDIPVAWLLLDDKELEATIEEKKRRDEEERKRIAEENRRIQAEESARLERIKEAEERATLLRLIEKYGIDGGDIKDD